MPALNLFLPPLLGGFLFVSIFYVTRYWIAREQGYKLVFAASIAGGLFWLIAELAFGWISGTRFGTWWAKVVPVNGSLESGIAFLIGAVIWLPLNLLGRTRGFLNHARVAAATIRRRGDPFEALLLESLTEQTPILLTLRSGKAYVGRVVRLPPAGSAPESILILMLRSGYRDSSTHALELNVDYERGAHEIKRRRVEELFSAEVAELIEANPQWADKDRSKVVEELLPTAQEALTGIESLVFTKTIFTREVVTAGHFDLELFDSHFHE